MENLIVGDKATVERLAERLKKAASHSEYQRIQCVLIRATLGSSATEIARLPGWSTATVHVLHSRWAREDEAIFDVHRRGGRHHQHLTPEQEAQLLAPFVERAQAGGMPSVAEIRQACRERTGRAVARSTVYRLLERHGWRKIVPRPRHPKADVAALLGTAGNAPGGRRAAGVQVPVRLQRRQPARRRARQPRAALGQRTDDVVLPGRAPVEREPQGLLRQPCANPVDDRIEVDNLYIIERCLA